MQSMGIFVNQLEEMIVIHLHTAIDVIGYENRYAMALYNIGGGGNPPRSGLVQNQYYVGKILEGGYFHVLKPDRMCSASEFLGYRLVSTCWSELSENEHSLLIALYNHKKLNLDSLSAEIPKETWTRTAKFLDQAGYLCWTGEDQTIELSAIGEIEVHNRIFNFDTSNKLDEENGGIRIQHHSVKDHEIDLAQSSSLSINLDGILIQILTLPNHGAIIHIDHEASQYFHLGRIARDKGFAQFYIDNAPSFSNSQIINTGDKLMTNKDIYLTSLDVERLQKMFSDPNLIQQKAYMQKLKDEINRAVIVDPSKILGDIVTMNSRVQLVDIDTQEEMIVTLVYPEQTNISDGRISILAPIGTAILGYGQGDIIQWEVPDGTRNLRIDDVLYQPEAAGVFIL